LNSNATIRRWRPRLAIACLLAITYVAFCFWPRPSYSYIIDELPSSAKIAHYEFVKQGLLDYSHLFEFSCADASIRKALVAKWELQDSTTSDEELASFVEHDHPDWWTPDQPKATHKYGRIFEETESYISIWEHPDTGRLYVESGRW